MEISTAESVMFIVVCITSVVTGVLIGNFFPFKGPDVHELETGQPTDKPEVETERDARIKRRTVREQAAKLCNLYWHLETLNTAGDHQFGDAYTPVAVGDFIAMGSIINTRVVERPGLKFLLRFTDDLLVVQLTDSTKYASLEEPGARCKFDLTHLPDDDDRMSIQTLMAKAAG